MKKLLFSALALLVAALPLSSTAGMGENENFNIFAWQNYSWEYIDMHRSRVADENRTENGPEFIRAREFDRINGAVSFIGFASHIDTGMPGLQVGMRCEQYTFHNRITALGWCTGNSKISLRHETMGELMIGQWLLPYNEIVAYWVDPFYHGGADSHTSLMGNIGYDGVFYQGGTFPGVLEDEDFTFNGVFALGFNRRQEEIIQYVWPNTAAMNNPSRDGFQFRFAITSGWNDDTDVPVGADRVYNLDPRLWSTGVSWQHSMMNGGQIWLAAAYQRHDDVTAYELSKALYMAPGDRTLGLGVACDDSEDDAWRIAGRYMFDWGDGANTMIAGMWEELDYDADNCRNVETGDVANVLWDDVDRDAWMVSAMHNFGNGWAAKFSYINADDLNCGDGGNCGAYRVGQAGVGATLADDGSTDADAWNVGLTYTMPAGTEMRLTYSKIDNSAGSDYDFGFGGVINQRGQDIDMWAIGIVQWFD